MSKLVVTANRLTEKTSEIVLTYGREVSIIRLPKRSATVLAKAIERLKKLDALEALVAWPKWDSLHKFDLGQDSRCRRYQEGLVHTRPEDCDCGLYALLQAAGLEDQNARA